jgi:hypothetical protein
LETAKFCLSRVSFPQRIECVATTPVLDGVEVLLALILKSYFFFRNEYVEFEALKPRRAQVP